MLAVGALALLFRYPEVYTALYAILLLPPASALFTFILLRLMTIEVLPAHPRVIKKEQTTYSVRFTSIIGYPLKIYRISEAVGLTQSALLFDGWAERADDVCIVTREPFVLTCPARFSYRGEYRVGVEAVELRDPLGLFTFRRRLNRTAAVTVCPRVVEPDDAGFDMLANNAEIRALHTEDDVDIADVRKYTDTDSYKRIHWKLSAKRNELMVRHFQSAAGRKLCLFLDVSPSTLAVEDMTVELALAYANRLLKDGVRVELAYALDSVVRLEAADAAGFGALYARLAELRFDTRMDITAALYEYVRAQDDFCTIVLFTHTLDEPVCESILEVSAQAYTLRPVFIAKNRSTRDETRNIERLEAAGICCTVVQSADTNPTAAQ